MMVFRLYYDYVCVLIRGAQHIGIKFKAMLKKQRLV